MEEQILTITIRSKGETCELRDEEIRAWYKEKLASLFDPEWGTPEIKVDVERKSI